MNYASFTLIRRALTVGRSASSRFTRYSLTGFHYKARHSSYGNIDVLQRHVTEDLDQRLMRKHAAFSTATSWRSLASEHAHSAKDHAAHIAGVTAIGGALVKMPTCLATKVVIAAPVTF
ncbi:hypothetical protein KCP78_06220 [Salmonella enterica subsp. enterica]|nr:hypothetical protein KCP78_06220 [Salmonella enterica subsp. enterica]